MSAPHAAIEGADLLARLRAHGFDFFTGVPCSLFGSFYRAVEQQDDVPAIAAVREDEAVGHAAGAHLAGRKPVVMMQNSGLGNALNAIASLSSIYQLPFLLLVTWRGFQGRDAPEHFVMGRAMPDILHAIALAAEVLDPERVEGQLTHADGLIAQGAIATLIVREGAIS